MGNCFSKICYKPIKIQKPLLEIAKIHKEEVTMLYVPVLNHNDT